MKNAFFKSMVLGLGLMLLSFSRDEIQTIYWNTDFERAKSAATSSEQIILMSFQGSDWCANCKRLEHTLFENSDFIDFYSGNLTMLKVDFPMKKENRLSKEQVKHNDALAEKFNPDGSFPKVIILNAKGEKLGEMTYPSKTVEEYITSIKTFIE